MNPRVLIIFCTALTVRAANPAHSNTLWIYSVPGLPDPVTDRPTGDTLIQNASASGVSVLYVSVYSSTPNSARRYLVDEASIATFIRKAHARNMQVYVSLGDSDWPAKGCATGATPHERFVDITGYDSDHPAVRFDGIILDVEPGRDPDLPSLLSLYRCLRRQAAASGLHLSAAISAFWNAPVTFNGRTKEAYKHIVDLKLTSLVVMGYRNAAGTLDCSAGAGVVCLDRNIVEYANRTGLARSILVGLDTDNPAISGAGADETFYSVGQAAMNAAATSVQSQFVAANLSFGGFSIHNYRNSYLSGTLPGWPATNPELRARSRTHFRD